MPRFLTILSAPLKKKNGGRRFWRLSHILFLFLLACSAVPNTEKSSQDLYRQGQVEMQAGNIQEALRFFHASLQSAREEGKGAGMAASLQAIALVHVHGKDWGKALFFMEQSLAKDRELLRSAQNRGREKAEISALEAKLAANLSYLARIHRNLGEPEKSLERLRELLQIDLKRGKKRGVAIAHNNMARILLALDRFDEARRHFNSAFVIFRGLGDGTRADMVQKNLHFLESIRKERNFPENEPAKSGTGIRR